MGEREGVTVYRRIYCRRVLTFSIRRQVILVCALEYVMDITKSKLASSFFQSQKSKTEQTIENT